MPRILPASSTSHHASHPLVHPPKQVVELTENDVGGCKLASAAISGAGGVYGRLKFESGIHRVQRVPATESGEGWDGTAFRAGSRVW